MAARSSGESRSAAHFCHGWSHSSLGKAIEVSASQPEGVPLQCGVPKPVFGLSRRASQHASPEGPVLSCEKQTGREEDPTAGTRILPSLTP